MTKKTILVAIPCLNEAAHIGRLLQQFCQIESVLIVVADGGSTDGTQKIVKDFISNNINIRLIHNDKKIQSAGINLAVKLFGNDSEYFIRIDAHADYPDNFITSLIKSAEITNADSVVIAMDTVGKTELQKVFAVTQNSKLGNGGSAHRNIKNEGLWVDHGHHALMRVSAFNQVEGYDESFVANEDAELDFRLGQSGFRIWLTSATLMTYYPRGTFTGLFKQYYKYGIGRASNVIKHKTIPKVRQLIPLSVFPALLLFFLYSVSLIFTLPFISWLTICLVYGIFLSIKNRKLIIILSGPSAAVMHLGWSAGFCRKLFSNMLFR
ncbi:glycosyltransferase family 2 protein [Shewanella livingstonensis]|uniref:Glycosyltransferase family 2 protein n=1 Tax=Shewanella livingstonensis TaxID=150120 RepID=A0A3G8LW38_9GAMM|nr:glycosyltransferase family 2 protein [Shewanella livingstonensis]AZG73849.1 glycosyltransferase family 2 protein [Shewanella livingstonensis]